MMCNTSTTSGIKNKGVWKGWKRTADSASVMMRCDFSLSFLSCVPRAISEARRRRFSTWRAEICALSSSIRTLSVELSLVGQSVSGGSEECEAWEERTL